MVELEKKYQIGVRRFGYVNWVGAYSLYKKEVLRFLVVYGQTLAGPILTSILFLIVISLAIGDEIQFVNTSTGDYISINWNFGDNSFDVQGENVTHTYNEAGTYVVTQTVEYPYGCVYEYTEIIEVTTGYGIVLPNAFTPNGDGINDTIRPWYNCMSSIELSIYDTFGSLLYVESSTDTIYGWDGTINGKEAENGNYVIVVRAVTLFGKQIELNGPVALIR